VQTEQLRVDCTWRQAGTVWAADVKQRREPNEGRYGWILAVKDLASRYQLAWLPVEEATADVVQATYARLFAEHGPQLVMKSYNGGIERANGQLAGYQEALAEFHGRPGMPMCDDARSAQRLANESTRPEGWRGPTAAELLNRRAPLTACRRTDFLAAVTEGRTVVRGQFG
jgi:hypothetical protein